MSGKLSIPEEVIVNKIYEIRGQKVMLDSDLAELYQVETKVLKQAVKRNLDIFPKHFMFELTKEENGYLRSQIVTSKKGRGGSRYLPMAFTEHGVLQLANVLRSKKAKKMSISIIEVFVKMREMLLTHKDLLLEMEKIRKKVSGNENQIELIFEYLKQFEKAKQEELEHQNRKKIGYKSKGKK